MEPEDGYILNDLGVQGDGEPAVADEPAANAEQAEPEAPAEPTNQEGEPANPEDAPEKPHKKPGSQRLKERLERVEAENEALRRLALSGNKPAEAVQAPGVDHNAPKPENFDTHEEWVDALTDYKVQKRIHENEAKAKAVAVQTAWETKMESAREEFEDFDEALRSAPAPSPAVAKVLLKVEEGAVMAYHLANDPKLLRELNAMEPEEAALALAELRSEIRASRKKAADTPKPTTKAPAPARPVQGSAAAVQEDAGYEVY